FRSFFRSRISSAMEVAASIIGGGNGICSQFNKPVIMGAVRILLISTYELGRQPFGLASPAAWLRAEGHDVSLADLSRTPLPVDAVQAAELIGFFLPMHTATRLIVRVIERVRTMNPAAKLSAFGLYAPLNEAYLRSLGVSSVSLEWPARKGDL